jgi:hypothetical protein
MPISNNNKTAPPGLTRDLSLIRALRLPGFDLDHFVQSAQFDYLSRLRRNVYQFHVAAFPPARRVNRQQRPYHRGIQIKVVQVYRMLQSAVLLVDYAPDPLVKHDTADEFIFAFVHFY